MKYCPHCGTEIAEDARFCANCGCPVNTGNLPANRAEEPVIRTVAKVFMIISTVIAGFAIIPLCWMIPMTVHYFNVTERGEKATATFAVCTLLFCSLVAGILMLVDDDR